jgi:hypothetical protein
LLKAGFLEDHMNGWLMVVSPAAPEGTSATWYGCFWEFISKYLESRFGDDYCLSAEASIRLHIASTLIPTQVSVTVQQPAGQTVKLKYGTSIFIYQTKEALPANRIKSQGLWIMDLAMAICRLSPTFYRTSPDDAEIALRMIREPSSLLRVLFEQNNVVVAGRLIGAYEFLGQYQISSQIKQAMESAGNIVRVSNPFENPEPLLSGNTRVLSPHVARIKMLWAEMRPQILKAFQEFPTRSIASGAYLAEMEARYVADAYNSLSIEGYRVTPELIEKVRANIWDPSASEIDSQELNAITARGYYQAFQSVKASIAEILDGRSYIDALENGFQTWYREMFSPAVRAGILQANQLAGYRDVPVYLRGSRHVPPAADSIVDCMEAYLDLMRNENEAIVRALLGHFIFVYIHPYPDGNGRIARFIMNTALASGGYPWTVIRQARRDEYLASLEEASANHNLQPFTEFVLKEMREVD